MSITDPPPPAATAVYPDLQGKVAVVTGRSLGIGVAAPALGRNGARIAIVGRDRNALDRTVNDLISIGATAIGVAADCTIEEDLTRLPETVNERLGQVGILAAYAGGSGMPVPTRRQDAGPLARGVESDLAARGGFVQQRMPGNGRSPRRWRPPRRFG